MTDTLASVLDTVSSVKPGVELAGETRIADLRLDSLDEVEILMALEEAHQVEIDQAQVKSCVTLADLARLVEEQRKPA